MRQKHKLFKRDVVSRQERRRFSTRETSFLDKRDVVSLQEKGRLLTRAKYFPN